MSELRKLQTDREIKQKLGINLPGIVDIRQVLNFTGVAAKRPSPSHSPEPQITKRTQERQIAELEKMLHGQITDEQAAILKPHSARGAEFAERTQLTPRNAPCTCGSGEKYKRCCGKDAPPVPGDWPETRQRRCVSGSEIGSLNPLAPGVYSSTELGGMVVTIKR